MKQMTFADAEYAGKRKQNRCKNPCSDSLSKSPERSCSQVRACWKFDR